MNPLAQELEYVLGRTEAVWPELRRHRLFITGGTGFLGCWLLESFVWANEALGLGASAVILTRNADAFRRKAPHLAGSRALEFVSGDVRTFQVPPGNFAYILHLAADRLNNTDPNGRLSAYETILDGTRRVLEFAREAGVRRVLLVSSGAVYGRQPPSMSHIPEQYSGAPDQLSVAAAYGEGKRCAELLGALYAKGFGVDSTVARCFAFVGPYMPLNRELAIGNFIRDGLRGGPIRITGDGRAQRSYLYAADLAIWLWTILVCGEKGRAYNVGSDQAVSILDTANIVAENFNPRPQVSIAKPQVSSKPAERYVPSIERARDELKLEAWIGLSEAVQRTVGWYSRAEADAWA